MRALLSVAAVLLVAGCGFTQAGTAFKAGAVAKGAKAYDEGLANAEFFVCNAASVGSVQRRYGRSADMAATWRALCLGNRDSHIIEEAPE